MGKPPVTIVAAGVDPLRDADAVLKETKGCLNLVFLFASMGAVICGILYAMLLFFDSQRPDTPIETPIALTLDPLIASTQPWVARATYESLLFNGIPITTEAPPEATDEPTGIPTIVPSVTPSATITETPNMEATVAAWRLLPTYTPNSSLRPTAIPMVAPTQISQSAYPVAPMGGVIVISTSSGGDWTPPLPPAPTDVPPTNVPPTNVPPTNAPPTNVPPTNVPPTMTATATATPSIIALGNCDYANNIVVFAVSISPIPEDYIQWAISYAGFDGWNIIASDLWLRDDLVATNATGLAASSLVGDGIYELMLYRDWDSVMPTERHEVVCTRPVPTEAPTVMPTEMATQEGGA